MNPLLAALVQAGIITPDEAERINRSLDPDAARAWAEQQMALAVQGGLSQQQARLVEMVRRSNGNLTPAALDAFWAAEDERLWQAVRPTLEDVAAENAIAAAVRLGADDAMWNAVNRAVIDWTNTYYTSASPDFVGSVRNLDQTSRQQVGEAFARWQRGELTEGRGGLPALIAELEPTFGPARSSLIASTEATRIAAESENAAAMAIPEIEFLEWASVFDELVCPICGPLNGRQVEKGRPFAPGVMLPPAHPNCRCMVTALTRPAANWDRVTPVAPTAPKISETQPTGTPIGETINAKLVSTLKADYGTVKYDYTEYIDPALKDINSVHGDGNLPRISVGPLVQKESRQTLGTYVHRNESSPFGNLPKDFITLRDKMSPLEAKETFTHEFGHLLDRIMIGGDSGYASEDALPILDNWRKVVSDSKAVKGLRSMLDDSFSGIELPNGKMYKPSKEYIDYLLDPREIWARSYSQYIATKTGNGAMATFGSSHIEVWDDEDFVPIANAIDGLFRGLGWIK